MVLSQPRHSPRAATSAPPLAPRVGRVTRSSFHSVAEAADAAQALVGLSGSQGNQGDSQGKRGKCGGTMSKSDSGCVACRRCRPCSQRHPRPHCCRLQKREEVFCHVPCYVKVGLGVCRLWPVPAVLSTAPQTALLSSLILARRYLLSSTICGRCRSCSQRHPRPHCCRLQ